MTCLKNNLGDDTSGLGYVLEPYGQNGEPVVCWESEPVRMSRGGRYGIDAEETRAIPKGT